MLYGWKKRDDKEEKKADEVLSFSYLIIAFRIPRAGHEME